MPVRLESEGEGKDRKFSDRRLEISSWMLAWDGYALAAAMLDQVLSRDLSGLCVG